MWITTRTWKYVGGISPKKKIVRCFLIKRQNREKKSSTRGRKRVKEIFNIKLHILRVTFDVLYGLERYVEERTKLNDQCSLRIF